MSGIDITSIKCRITNCNDEKDKRTIRFVRHAQSYQNIDIMHKRNAEITDACKLQARRITGKYDLAIVSPLRRTMQTLQYSAAEFGTILKIDNNRERKGGH